jgi:hypothetical protein
MRSISILYYIDIAFYLAILVITEVLSSENKIKKYYIRVNFVVIININIVFSNNLLVII